jgi:hypothetical protein
MVPDLHDDYGTHIPVLYQIYMMIMVHMYLYCTTSTWWWWYTYTCIVPDLHDYGTHIPVLYQIYMMIMVMCTIIIMLIWYNIGTCVPSSSCRSATIQVHVYHHHHVDLVQYRYMCTIIIMLIWYNRGTCVPSSCRSGTIQVHVYHHHYSWWWYTCTCIVPD